MEWASSTRSPGDGALPLGHAKPILVGQLKRVELLSLVHSAHEKGLETYISAGMQPEHMRDATYTEVGAVGIGTSLHHRSKDGIIGQVDAVALRKVLEVRKGGIERVPAILASDLAHLIGSITEAFLPTEVRMSGDIPSLKL